MPNKKANAWTTVGLIGCAIGLTTACAPIAAIGIPAILSVRGLRAILDKKEERKRKNKRKGDEAMLPTTVSHRLFPDISPYNPYQSYLEHLTPKNPLTALAEQSPKLASEVMTTKYLTEASQIIMAGPTMESIRQGRKMNAKIIRRKRLFSDSIIIKT